MSADHLHHISSASEFDQLAGSTKYVLVDFFADWCPPCKAIAPLYAKLAAANATEGGLAFAKVNVDDVSELGERYGITAMPTFLVLEDGKPAAVPVPGVSATPSVQVSAEGGVKLIRGADPRALISVAEHLGKLAKSTTAGADKSANGDGEKKGEDTETVS